MCRILVFPITLSVILLFSNPVKAQEAQNRGDRGLATGWEMRLGFYAHSIYDLNRSTSPNIDHAIYTVIGRERGVDMNIEILGPPLPFTYWPSFLRLRLGSSISLLKQTHLFHGGFALEVFEFVDFLMENAGSYRGGELLKYTDPFFFGIGIGIGFHTGSLIGTPTQRALGCRWIFQMDVSMGVNFLKHHSIMATVEHASNGSRYMWNFCTYNQGLDNAGLRYGYRF